MHFTCFYCMGFVPFSHSKGVAAFFLPVTFCFTTFYFFGVFFEFDADYKFIAFLIFLYT